MIVHDKDEYLKLFAKHIECFFCGVSPTSVKQNRYNTTTLVSQGLAPDKIPHNAKDITANSNNKYQPKKKKERHKPRESKRKNINLIAEKVDYYIIP